MLSLSTTSTFEYPYLDTMGENTKGIYFGGQSRCIILPTKTGHDRLFRLDAVECIAFQANNRSTFDMILGHTPVPVVDISYTENRTASCETRMATKCHSDPENMLRYTATSFLATVL